IYGKSVYSNMPAGYSGTPLARKLGIKASMKLYAHEAPTLYSDLLVDLPEEAEWISDPQPKALDFVHGFFLTEQALLASLQDLKALLRPNATLWLSWPKKSSSLHTDLDRELIREHGLASGLVDVKVCAVDQDWSALKFVYRKEDRWKE
ncbi:MAG: hypothetical protein AAGM67_14440, partial [Bacteroidota bacterium]